MFNTNSVLFLTAEVIALPEPFIFTLPIPPICPIVIS
nr:MAG TPA: hypothetical protein [Caudoviricetes sp.]